MCDPIVRSHIGTLDEGDMVEDAQAVADALATPVFEPTWWPQSVVAVRYSVSLPVPVPGLDLDLRHYQILGDTEGSLPLLVRGSRQRSSAQSAAEGWFAPAELRHAAGRARERDGNAQAVMNFDEVQVHLVLFAGLDDVLRAALSLRRVAPA